MKNIITTGTTIALLFFVVLLTGCSDPAEPEVAQEQAVPVPVVVDQTEVPVGRLGQAVQPVHYRLEFQIDPKQENFSGKVEIDVDAKAALNSIWLHARTWK